MGMLLLGLLLAVLPLVAGPGVYLGYRLAMRRPPVAAAPPTPALGDEPPAVVNLLAHQDRVTVDAAEATLLDLASRRIVELWAADATGAHTVVRVRQPDPPDLTSYEALVLDRIRQRATDGTVPLTALAFKDRRDAQTFLRRFGHHVVDAAIARGLVEPALTRYVWLTLAQVAFPVIWIITVVLWHPGLLLFIVPITVLTVLAWRQTRGRLWELRRRWQLTPSGRERAAHWLGVRDWLRSFPAFADLPPAAVAVWDRYLAYGAALDATPSTSGAIELGFDRKPRLWSSYGGRWRRIRVRTKTWAAIRMVMIHPATLAPELVVLLFCGCGPVVAVLGPTTKLVVVCLTGLLPISYLVIRRLIDAAHPARVIGVVLHVRYLGRQFFASDLSPRALVIDAGSGDRLTEWLLYDRDIEVSPGDLVQGTGRLWHRRLKPFVVLRRAATVPPARPAHAAAATFPPAVRADPAWAGPAAVAPAPYPDPVRNGNWIADVLPAAELSRILGVPVSAMTAGSAVSFLSTVDNQRILRLEMRNRTSDPESWSAHPVGWALHGVGDEAYCGPGWAVARTGPQVVLADGWPPSFPQAPAEVLGMLLTRWHLGTGPAVGAGPTA